MININHPASSLDDTQINKLIKDKVNLIQITVQTNSGFSTLMSLNRQLFKKGCASQQVAQTAKNDKQKGIVFNILDQFDQLCKSDEFDPIYQKWIRYLCSGKLAIDPKLLGLYFALACSFKTKKFFHSLIDSKCKMFFEHKMNKQIILKCCFDIYKDSFNEEGKYNFFWHLFQSIPVDWFSLAKTQFREDYVMESFIEEYCLYRGQKGLFDDNDIQQLINIYKQKDLSSDEAKLKIKKAVQWERIPIGVLNSNRVYLKFTDKQLMTMLRKRLHILKIQSQDQHDQQLMQLKDTKDKLQKKYQNLLIKKEQQQIQLQLAKGGQKIHIQKQYQEPYHSGYRAPNSNSNSKIYKMQVYDQQMDKQLDLEQQVNIVLSNRPPSRFQQDQPIKKPKNNSKNSKIKHNKQDNPNCQGQQSMTLECGCQICLLCLKIIYIQKSDQWNQLDLPKLQIEVDSFRKYGVKCYSCRKQMTQIDAQIYMMS